MLPPIIFEIITKSFPEIFSKFKYFQTHLSKQHPPPTHNTHTHTPKHPNNSWNSSTLRLHILILSSLKFISFQTLYIFPRKILNSTIPKGPVLSFQASPFIFLSSFLPLAGHLVHSTHWYCWPHLPCHPPTSGCHHPQAELTLPTNPQTTLSATVLVPHPKLPWHRLSLPHNQPKSLPLQPI